MPDSIQPAIKRKARKDHVCSWCGEKILKGETYIHYVGVYEGELQDTKLHTECNEACLRYMDYESEYTLYDNPRGFTIEERDEMGFQDITITQLENGKWECDFALDDDEVHVVADDEDKALAIEKAAFGVKQYVSEGGIKHGKEYQKGN